jgi:ketopantoate reductase
MSPEPSDEEEEQKLTLMAKINTLVAITGSDFEKIRETYKVKSTADMTLEQLKNCVAVLEKKKEKKDKEGK